MLGLLTLKEVEFENQRAERAWKDSLFLHDRPLYFELYKERAAQQETGVQYRVPQTVGELAEVFDMIRQAGGPELEFPTEESIDDDWSWVERFKAKQAEEEANTESHTPDTPGNTEAFDALRSQDIDSG